MPKYPLPVALIGRLAVDERAQGRRIGEQLLIDAMQRVVDAAEIVGCVGIIVDAKDESAEAFYEKYDFVSLETGGWPRRMFVSLGTFAPPSVDQRMWSRGTVTLCSVHA